MPLSYVRRTLLSRRQLLCLTWIEWGPSFDHWMAVRLHNCGPYGLMVRRCPVHCQLGIRSCGGGMHVASHPHWRSGTSPSLGRRQSHMWLWQAVLLSRGEPWTYSPLPPSIVRIGWKIRGASRPHSAPFAQPSKAQSSHRWELVRTRVDERPPGIRRHHDTTSDISESF